MQTTTVEYKGYKILVSNYLELLSTFDEKGNLMPYPFNRETSSSNFYQIWDADKCILDTLWNDDKMWTITSAIESAKQKIDSY